VARVEITTEGLDDALRVLDRLNLKANPGKRAAAKILISIANEIASNAQSTQILRGGGKGPATDPPTKVTSRTGTLRRSIAVDRGELGSLIVSIGTDLVYGAVHEEGGRIKIPQTRVREHKRKSAFGKKFPAFTVPAHTRKAHTAKYPKRPFLRPARDAIIRNGTAERIVRRGIENLLA